MPRTATIRPRSASIRWRPCLEALEQRSLLTITNLTPGPAFATTVHVGNYEIGTFSDTDPSAQAADFGAGVKTGDENVDNEYDGALEGFVTSLGNGVFEVSGSVGYSVPGTFHPVATLYDKVRGDSAQLVDTSGVVVTEPPITLTPLPFTGFAGVPLNLLPVSTFQDPGLDPDWGNGSGAPSYNVTIDWGDGSAPEVIDDNDGYSEYQALYDDDVIGAHTYNSPGMYQISVEVVKFQGDATISASTVTTATILPIPTVKTASFSAVEGADATVTYATFSEPDPNLAASSIPTVIGDSYDGMPFNGTQATVTALGGGEFAVTAPELDQYQYPGVDPYQVRLGVVGGLYEDGGGPYVIDGTATIEEAPIAATGSLQVGVAGADSPTVPTDAGPGGAPILAHFDDPDTAIKAADFFADVDWGDGTSTTGITTTSGAPLASLSADPDGGFDVRAEHIYARPGTYSAVVTVHDEEQVDNPSDAPFTPAVGTATSTIDVAPPPAIAGQIVPTSAMDLIGSSLSTTDPSISFRGSVTPGAQSVQVVAIASATGATTKIGTATPDGSGDWSIVGMPLASGRYQIEAIAISAQDATMAEASIIPVGPITDVLVGPPVQPKAAIVPNDSMDLIGPELETTDPSLTLRGTAAGAASVRILAFPIVGGNPTILGSTNPDASGNWNLTGSALPTGRYTLGAFAFDADGRLIGGSLVVPVGPIEDVEVVAPRITAPAVVPAIAGLIKAESFAASGTTARSVRSSLNLLRASRHGEKIRARIRPTGLEEKPKVIE